MTLNDMTAALNETMAFGTDYAGFFDISEAEAERIASRCESADDFRRIWENESWWRDAE